LFKYTELRYVCANELFANSAMRNPAVSNVLIVELSIDVIVANNSTELIVWYNKHGVCSRKERR
jgi:hypothetical protein